MLWLCCPRHNQQSPIANQLKNDKILLLWRVRIEIHSKFSLQSKRRITKLILIYEASFNIGCDAPVMSKSEITKTSLPKKTSDKHQKTKLPSENKSDRNDTLF